jgi:hypothetical protein
MELMFASVYGRVLILARAFAPTEGNNSDYNTGNQDKRHEADKYEGHDSWDG